ncbi:MAG TPA: SGNH/GDSL hydrolase family protein [Stellaceae bacterium]|nr:SGNH/GDSL hydrolase family protein [Stellaceae bacterium]
MSGALAGLVLLVIGDSHMSHMTATLHDRLESAGAAVHTYYMCGSPPNDWVYPSQIAPWGNCGKGERHEKSPAVVEKQALMPSYQLSALLQKNHPNVVIVQGGDTLGGYTAPDLPKGWAYDQVHTLVTRIQAANVSCVWIGPIYGDVKSTFHKSDDRVRELSQFLAQSVAPCSYVDSLKFSRPHEWPTVDGVHLTQSGYEAWSTDIVNALVALKTQNRLR